jgi:hypothetical protein
MGWPLPAILMAFVYLTEVSDGHSHLTQEGQHIRAQ